MLTRIDAPFLHRREEASSSELKSMRSVTPGLRAKSLSTVAVPARGRSARSGHSMTDPPRCCRTYIEAARQRPAPRPYGIGDRRTPTPPAAAGS